MQKNPFVVASLPDNPVNEPADLVGKRIGMALANTPVLQALCSLNGVDINAIEIVPTQYSAQPLLSGEVDCLLCWETDLPIAMAMQGVESVTMLMADHGYAVHSQTYIATDDSLANRRADLVALMSGEVRGWEAYRADTKAAAALTLEMYPDAGLDLATQELQAERQVPLMFSELTEANGFGSWTDDAVAANIETLALLGRTVTPDLWDRSILDEVHGAFHIATRGCLYRIGQDLRRSDRSVKANRPDLCRRADDRLGRTFGMWEIDTSEADSRA